MGGVSLYFSRAFGSGVDVTLLSKVLVFFLIVVGPRCCSLSRSPILRNMDWSLGFLVAAEFWMLFVQLNYWIVLVANPVSKWQRIHNNLWHVEHKQTNKTQISLKILICTSAPDCKDWCCSWFEQVPCCKDWRFACGPAVVVSCQTPTHTHQKHFSHDHHFTIPAIGGIDVDPHFKSFPSCRIWCFLGSTLQQCQHNQAHTKTRSLSWYSHLTTLRCMDGCWSSFSSALSCCRDWCFLRVLFGLFLARMSPHTHPKYIIC